MTAARNQSVMPRGLPSPSMIRLMRAADQRRRRREIKRRVAMRWLKWRLVYDRDAKYGEIPAGNH